MKNLKKQSDQYIHDEINTNNLPLSDLANLRKVISERVIETLTK